MFEQICFALVVAVFSFAHARFVHMHAFVAVRTSLQAHRAETMVDGLPRAPSFTAGGTFHFDHFATILGAWATKTIISMRNPNSFAKSLCQNLA